MPERSDPPTLPSHVDDSVQSIAKLHADHRERATRLRRAIEFVTARAARPAFSAGLAIGMGIWIALNLGLVATGRKPLDEPPFAWLQGVVGLLALAMTTLVLATQRHDDELASHRDQLTLELAILNERKIAKVIELLEALRRDDPHTRDRVDAEADAMTSVSDPNAVLDAIKAKQ